MVNYDQNNYLDQYRDLTLFYGKYVGEPMMNPIITYDKTKRWYPFEISDLRFQVDHKSPKKNRFWKENCDNPVNTIIYIYICIIFLRKHKVIKMISHSYKVISVENV